ncbi:hypothetical protein [Bosea sp. MMO-172]|uniref:hypothetical protein n=1 Tax=Bosea sp. MMO-172 TaxID=3127885 RepID=UPI00301A0F4E
MIDTVDLPFEELKKLGLTDGNKQRVIALSMMMNDLNKNETVRFLVDRDLDEWVGEKRSAKGLFSTKYCCMEMYFFEEEIIKDIILICSESKIDKWSDFYRKFAAVLTDYFSYRLARHEHDATLSIPNIEQCLEMKDLIHIDIDRFNTIMCTNNKRNDFVDEIHNKSASWKKIINGKNKLSINGHDFINTMVWCINKFKGHRKFADKLFVERLLVMHSKRIIEIGQIFENPTTDDYALRPA